MKIAVLGAGAWGTALAHHASLRHPVVLWARDARQAAQIAEHRENPRALPGLRLEGNLRATASLDEALNDQDLLVIATAMAGLRPVAAAIAAHPLGRQRPVLWLCKGLEADTARLPGEVIAEVWHQAVCGALSGPSFAQEVAAGLPVALTVASTDLGLTDLAIAAFHHRAVRIYRSTDVVGVEVAGAVKNVMAIATGISDGLGLGANARAALLTRGLAEIVRYGRALGAQPETFIGLAGVGDLVLTCTGDLSRNRQVGLALGRGERLDVALGALGHVAEGVACCRAVCASARALGVEMPITDAVAAVLFEGQSPREAVSALLAREPRAERDAVPHVSR